MPDDSHAKALGELDPRLVAVLIDRILYHEVGVGILICDNGGHLIFANASSRNMAGIGDDRDIKLLTLDDFGSRFYSDQGAPVPREEWPVTKALSGELVIGVEMSVRRQDGSFYEIMVNGVPLVGDEGTVYGAYSTYMDLSKEKEHERELKRREEQLASVLDVLPVGVAGFLPSGELFFENSARRRIWEQRTNEQKRFSELYLRMRPVGAPVPFSESPAMKVFSTGVPQAEQFFDIDCFNGSRKTVAISAFPMKENNSVVAAIGVIRDVTREVAVEEEVVRIQRQLHQRVETRTSELEAAYRELESFSYSVSHDLRAPLRNIYGYTQLLMRRYETSLEAQAKEYLQRIRMGVEKMDRLIDDILRLSRVGRTEMKRERVDLSAVAEKIVTELQESRPDRSGDFHIHRELVVEGDGNLLQVALYNLLENAWKYTEKKEYATIRFGRENGAFVVSDNGAGFDMTHAERLFAPFQRLHPESDFGGTGIGLAIVKKIIQKHKGRVWAKGEEGKGASFYFTLWEME